MFSRLAHAAGCFLWKTDEEWPEFESFDRRVQWSFPMRTGPRELDKEKVRRWEWLFQEDNSQVKWAGNQYIITII